MRSAFVLLALVSVLTVGACSSSTAPSNCSVHATTAAYRDMESFAVTVTSVSTSALPRLVEASDNSGPIRFLVADTTPVFIRVADGTPTRSSLCRLAVGETVVIPFGAGFEDFENPAPVPTIEQVVIQRQQLN